MPSANAKACKAAAAIVSALRDVQHIDAETAAGLAHFYAATAACSAREHNPTRASPPFEVWIREILARRRDIHADNWLAARPIVGQRGQGAKLYFETANCPQHRLTLLSSTDKQGGNINQADVADKVVCDADAMLSDAPCRVLSVGSDGDAAFEEAVHRRWPRCSIDVFDGTLTGRRAYLRDRLPSYVRFVPHNFGPTSWRAYEGQTVAILKIDCERCEHKSLRPWLEHVCTEQILLEMHPLGYEDDGNRTARLLAAISHSHAPFFAVHNNRAGLRRGGRYAEIAWRRRQPCPHAAVR